MILYNTPDEQVFRKMYREMEKVDFAVEKRTHEVDRMKITTKTRLPVILQKEYTVPKAHSPFSRQREASSGKTL